MAKILCVDDESNVVKLKCAILQAAGHQVTGCTSAKEAIDHINKADYDAIVTVKCGGSDCRFAGPEKKH